MMSPVRVRTSSSAIRAIPKSVSFAVPGPPSASGQMTLEGLTSRWMTPRLWACASARAERRADPQDVAVRQRAVAQQVGERRPLDELGDEVDGVLVAAGFVERDDPGVREPRGGQGLALAAAVGSSPIAMRLTATSRSRCSSRAR